MSIRNLYLSLKGGNIQMSPNIDSWEGIAETYLKASDLKDLKGSFVVLEDVEITDDDKVQFSTMIDDVSYKVVLNATNTKFIKKKLKSPKDLIGKRLSYEKIRVRNPQTQQMVDGISIVDVE